MPPFVSTTSWNCWSEFRFVRYEQAKQKEEYHRMAAKLQQDMESEKQEAIKEAREHARVEVRCVRASACCVENPSTKYSQFDMWECDCATISTACVCMFRLARPKLAHLT